MDQDYKSDIHLFYLTKEDDYSIADFEVNFVQPISFDRPMEVALVEMNLPKDIFISNYYHRKMIVDLKLEYLHPWLYYDYKPIDGDTGETYDTKKEYLLEAINYNISTLEKKFESICKDADDFALAQFKRKYTTNLDNLEKDLLPFENIKINYDPITKKFSSTFGKIWAKYQPGLLIPVIKYGFNFNKNLHEILGFNITKFPRIRLIMKNHYDTMDSSASFPLKYSDQIDQIIKIENDYEFGLTVTFQFFDISKYDIPGYEISYPLSGGSVNEMQKRTWFFEKGEYTNDDFKTLLEMTADEINEWAKKEFEFKFRIEDNGLPSTFEPIKKLTLTLDKTDLRIKFSIGKIRLKDKNGKLLNIAKYYPEFPENTHELLGFNPGSYPVVKNINDGKEIEDYDEFAENSPINLDIDSFYVYSDIIKESYINDTKVNILRIFQRDKKTNDEVISYSFDEKLFIPLRVKEITSIKISIRNVSADELFFTRGGIRCTLLIRPIEYI